MIPGFYEETRPLDEYETRTLLPIMLQGLKTKTGKALSVTSVHIVKSLKTAGYKINDARVRKLINHIRTADLIPGLVATSNGYYIANNQDELSEYIESLRRREAAIREVRESLERQAKLMRCPETQKNLFTE